MPGKFRTWMKIVSNILKEFIKISYYALIKNALHFYRSLKFLKHIFVHFKKIVIGNSLFTQITSMIRRKIRKKENDEPFSLLLMFYILFEMMKFKLFPDLFNCINYSHGDRRYGNISGENLVNFKIAAELILTSEILEKEITESNIS